MVSCASLKSLVPLQSYTILLLLCSAITTHSKLPIVGYQCVSHSGSVSRLTLRGLKVFLFYSRVCYLGFFAYIFEYTDDSASVGTCTCARLAELVFVSEYY